MNILHNIRDGKNLSKFDIYNGLMSKYAYDKLEKDISNAIVGDLLLSLDRLGISIEEFIFLSKDDSKLSKYHLIKEIKKLEISNNENELMCLMEKYKSLDKNMYYLLKSIHYMHHNEYDKAKNFAQKIWNSLKSFNAYTPSDIFLLSHIFYLFPLSQSKGIIQILEKNFVALRNFDEFYKTEIAFYLNAGRYLSELDFQKSKSFYDKALKLAIKYENGKYAGIAYVRIGQLTKNINDIEKGKYLLNIFSPSIWHYLKDDI
ncbi:hypothetical protein [Staphylococcus americanisciuri]|uniref:Transcriptional regulator n=1 Tax=Staphylococcus americanisciuri TaxID=2973940 RepID=A0ABT2F354_9STAP|nr:hypothetical protein [Staphylococcus americanisciuri]MCS4486839.1 hypothetical protein [Staphylococcus americanisciuri]